MKSLQTRAIWDTYVKGRGAYVCEFAVGRYKALVIVMCMSHISVGSSFLSTGYKKCSSLGIHSNLRALTGSIVAEVSKSGSL